MQDDAVSPLDIKSRVRVLTNRAAPPDYPARTRLYFIVLLAFALLMFVFALMAEDRDASLLRIGLGLIVGCVGYGIARLTFGRRVFFASPGFTAGRLVAIAIVLAIAIGGYAFPEFRRELFDAIWFLIAVGTFLAVHAFEGFLRREWES